MKLIIAGGRDYHLTDADREFLDSIEGVEEVVVNAEVIDGKAQPLLIYSETKKKTADGAA